MIDVAALVEGVRADHRLSIGRALTLVESQLPAHRPLAHQLLQSLSDPAAPASQRVGVTGPPGAGKSTLIETLGLAWIEQGHKVGVLAIDPSSQTRGGSILGDKTRMERLSQSERAFLRPSPAGTTLGGVARRTRECIRILEAAGYRRIIVETVGVGQSEIAVAQLVDSVLLVALPGAGDDVQGIKRGLMETADIVFVNKAEGDQAPLARAAANYLSMALRLLKGSEEWRPPVICGSALQGSGLGELLQALEDHARRCDPQLRHRQALHWFRQELEEQVLERFYAQSGVRERLRQLEAEVAAGQLTPEQAVTQLL